jgi:hypothetical protein
MTDKHYCWICGRRAIAFHPEIDGRKTYLCEEHLPSVDKTRSEGGKDTAASGDD